MKHTMRQQTLNTQITAPRHHQPRVRPCVTCRTRYAPATSRAQEQYLFCSRTCELRSLANAIEKKLLSH